MKFLPTILPILGLIVLPSVHAQPVSTAALGSTVSVWSGHTTVRERVDAGVNERIELWNRAWIVSPSGQVHENTTHWGFSAPDGYAATSVTFSETGRWTFWASDAGSIDTFVYGDSPWAWYMFPHNPPNGVGYGGAGRRVTAFIDVESPTTYALTTSVSGSGSVSGGGNYSAGSTATVTATPISGHAFAGWQGALSGTTNPASITMDAPKSVTAVFVALNSAPTITWSVAPSSAASGQSYTITAHGHDTDGNLTQVNVWKNGAPFAFSGGGNGTDGDSGNTTSDPGPTSITYTAQAVDGAGATSGTISHTVSISAANRAPTITWTSTPSTVASSQNYTVSAHGHDDDGNLTQVNVWKNGAPFAFAGGGNGTDGDSGNATSDSGPATITYTAEAVDANGAHSATISQTVIIGAPPAVTASISASPTSANVPGATTITWSSANATAVSVSGSGLNSSATSGTQAVSGLPAGTYTYTITAQGTGGPVTQTATFTVNAVASVSASISASPTNTTAPGTSTISWSSANATSVSVSGPGLSSTSASGTQSVSGLSAGTYSYTITAEGPNGPATQTATVTVNAPANSTPTISWNTTPGSVANGQNYIVSAHGHDADGNLTQVNVWKNGAPFAFAGGGNGTDGDSGNTTSDAGPTTITFTANAVDALGATSATITQTVTVAAPLAVSASISASPATATAPGSTTITWSSNNATSDVVSGNGLSSGAASGSQTINGLPAGTYTYTITAQGTGGPVTQTATFTVNAPANSTPTISWNTTPGSVANGQDYTVSAHGHDADGNLTQVNVWKNAAPFAFAGGGNGTDGDSGNTTSDAGPATITFTANAVDALGATSGTITQAVNVAAPLAVSASISASPTSTTAPGTTMMAWSSNNASSAVVSGSGLSSTATSGTQAVSGLPAGTYTYTITAQGIGGPVTQTATFTVNAPANDTPTISWNTTPGSVANGHNYTVSAHGHDADGNLAQVNVWKNGAPFAFGGGGNGTDGDSGNTTADAGPATIIFTANAVDAAGATSATITQTVTVAAPLAVSASISASPATTTAPGSTTITWSSNNATSVSVAGTGLNSTAASGSQAITGLAAGSYDYTITAQGPNGPVVQTATVTAAPAATVSGTISTSPSMGTEPASTTVAWSTVNASSVVVSGPGLSSAADTGSQTVSGLTAGTQTYTLTAQGPGGPITRTATFTVSATVPNVSGSIAASPTTTTAPGATTITWTTANATSVLVSGPGLATTSAAGTQNVTGLPSGNHTFTLVAQGNGGPLTRTVTITVNAGANVTAAISVSPATMNMGGIATLSWSTANASSVRVTGFGISGSSYQTNPNLTITIGGLPPGQSTWTLVAEGSGGPITRTATINVNSTDGLYGSLTISPAVIYSNQTASLAWTSIGANFKWVHGQLPGVNGVSVYPAPTSGSAAVPALPPGEYSFVFEYGPGAFSASRVAYAYLTVLGVNRTVAVSANPAGAGAVTGAGTYAEGASATLTATPDATHVFTGWSGDLTGATNPLTFTVGAQNYAVVANFALRTFTVAASVTPAGAGTVAGAGSYTAGSTASLTATPDATHSFTGWTGDISSAANPLSFLVNGNVSVTANFAATSFALTTAATGGGSVTPGGTYPAGTMVTLSATPDATHRFTNWSGDASGSAPSTAVTVDRAKFVQANFTGKTAQTIAFDPPGDHGLTSPPFTLSAIASSGLPVSFTLLGGPANLIGNSVQVTGAGPVIIEANQPGDAYYLPAPPVNQTFNVIAAATLKYRGQSRTLLRDETTRETPPFVLEKP